MRRCLFSCASFALLALVLFPLSSAFAFGPVDLQENVYQEPFRDGDALTMDFTNGTAGVVMRTQSGAFQSGYFRSALEPLPQIPNIVGCANEVRVTKGEVRAEDAQIKVILKRIDGAFSSDLLVEPDMYLFTIAIEYSTSWSADPTVPIVFEPRPEQFHPCEGPLDLDPRVLLPRIGLERLPEWPRVVPFPPSDPEDPPSDEGVDDPPAPEGGTWPPHFPDRGPLFPCGPLTSPPTHVLPCPTPSPTPAATPTPTPTPSEDSADPGPPPTAPNPGTVAPNAPLILRGTGCALSLSRGGFSVDRPLWAILGIFAAWRLGRTARSNL